MVKTFGWIDAIRMYLKVKVEPSGSLFANKYGTYFYLRPNSSDYYTFDQVFLKRQYEIDLPFVPKKIIDAGANIGLSAVYFAHRYPEATIIALEPDKSNFEILKKNISNYSHIIPLCKGLWDKNCALTITNTSSVQNAYMVQEADTKEKDIIPAISVNAIISEQAWVGIDILKIDIEGAEKEVFETNYEDLVAH